MERMTKIAVSAFISAALAGPAIVYAQAAATYSSSSSSSSYCGGASSSSSSSSSSVAATQAISCTLGHQNAWSNGYVASFDVTNTSDEPIHSWATQLHLGTGDTIAHLWSGELDVQSSVVTNVGWNGSLQPGQTTSFGFQASYDGEYVEPTCSAELANRPPEIDVAIDTTDLTVFVDASATKDPDGDALTYSIQFDGYKTHHRTATSWHTFPAPGDYQITVIASDGQRSQAYRRSITLVDDSSENRPPVARLYLTSSGGSVGTYHNLSYDPDGDQLTYDLTSEANNGYEFVTLTVSDGELSDTVQAGVSYGCNTWWEASAQPDFSYRIEGNKLFVDGSPTTGVTTEVEWDFGDGSGISNAYPYEAHDYQQSGQYTVTLYANSYPHRYWEEKVINVGNGLNNSPVAGLTCWERRVSEQDPWVECRPLGSFDPDGDNLILTWTMSDGAVYTTTSLDEPVTHVFEEAGGHTATLTVDDGTDSATATTYIRYMPVANRSGR